LERADDRLDPARFTATTAKRYLPFASRIALARTDPPTVAVVRRSTAPEALIFIAVTR
jgi:hypothetical protein